MKMKRSLLLVSSSWLLGFPLPAAASGVLEINQTCAVQTGCFIGDAAGFPVTITRSGSYRLTSNLSRSSGGGAQSTDFIEIREEDVSLDLAGFGLTCSAFQINTECNGDGNGISSDQRGTSVRNGRVTGVAADGIALSSEAIVTDVIVTESGSDGVRVGSFSVVTNVIAGSNGALGITAGAASSVSKCTSHGNGSAGIVASSGSTFHGNASFANGGSGFSAGAGSTVIGNSARSNGGDGFSLSGGPGNTTGGLAKGNVATFNDGYGFDNGILAPQFPAPLRTWGLIDNVARQNDGDPENDDQIRGGIELGQNLCGTSDLICP